MPSARFKQRDSAINGKPGTHDTSLDSGFSKGGRISGSKVDDELSTVESVARSNIVEMAPIA